LSFFNTFFTYLFIVELVMKLLALGPIKYLKDRMNHLDGAVVIISIIEMVFLNKEGSLSAFRTIRIFRTFRVLRVARILRQMKSMMNIISVLSLSLSSFVYLCLLLFLFVFIYALLGMQIFGGKFNFIDE